MPIYVISEKRRAKADRDPVRGLMATRDGFSWGACLLGPFWLANSGAFGAAIADWGLLALLWLGGDVVDPVLIACLFVALRLFMGFEGHQAVRSAARRRGFKVETRLAAGDEEEAVARFLAQPPRQEPPVPPQPSVIDTSLFPAGALAKRLKGSRA